MTNTEKVIAEARALLGVRFQHQGRNPQHGLDCLGFLLVTAERAGLHFHGQAPSALDQCWYGSRPDAVKLKQQLDQWLELVFRPAEAGDIVLLAIQGQAQHLALVSDYPLQDELGMIHAYAVARRIVEHRYDTEWRKATRAVYRLPA